LFSEQETLFDNPKPVQLIRRFLELGTNKDGIILDFFSGSATTAHAVMQLNAEDGGNRQYILVQLPEDLDKSLEAATNDKKQTLRNAIAFCDEVGVPHHLSEIGKERIRRAGEKIKADIENQNAQLTLTDEPKQVPDIGFKVFRVADTNIRWTHEALRERQLDLYEGMLSDKERLDFMPGFTDIDVVYEVLLRQRDIPLSAKVEKLDDCGERTYLFADAYVVCLDEEITVELVEQLAAIEPTPIKYVLRDSAFGDDISLKDETIRRLEAYIARNSGGVKKTYTVEMI
jgi:adenine-specific DNA-methyltransferase